MFVVFLHGPAASGKFTIGKALSEELGVGFFHNHLIVDALLALFEFGSPEFIRLREQIWLECFAAAAKADRSFVFTFAPEATVSPGFVDEARRVVEAEGGTTHYVHLTCPDPVLETRLSAESRKAFRKLTSVEVFRANRAAGKSEYPALPDPLLRVATDQVTAEQAVQAIVNALSAV